MTAMPLAFALVKPPEPIKSETHLAVFLCFAMLDEGCHSRYWKQAMLDELVGKIVVLDLRSPFVCLGKLHRLDEHFLELTNADLHDLRDTQTTRENYVAAAQSTGIK